MKGQALESLMIESTGKRIKRCSQLAALKALVEDARRLGLAKMDRCHGYFIILLGDLR